MTFYEKLTFAISVAAILVSLISPFITYYLLDPQIQTFRNRGRIAISESDVSYVQTVIVNPKVGSLPITIPTTDWGLIVENVGNLPAKDTALIFRYEPYRDARPDERAVRVTHPRPETLAIQCDPPVDFEVSVRNDDEFNITFKRPIAPGGKIRVSPDKVPDIIWATNEFNESTNLRTTANRIRYVKQMDDGSVKEVFPGILDVVK